MKYFLFIPLIMLTFLRVNAQNCKYDFNKVDAFTGTKKIEKEVEVHKGFLKPIVKFNFRKYDNQHSIELVFSIASTMAMTVDMNDELLLKLDNDSIVTLRPIDIAIGKILYLAGSNVSVIRPIYSINSDQLQMLSKNSIKMMRISMDNEYLDLNIMESNSLKVNKVAQCMLDLG